MPRSGFGLLGVFLLGALTLGGLNAALDTTSETEFCIACHEMEAFAFAEYAMSSHYANAAGVRAECADCHLPRAGWLVTTWRKIYVSKDLYHHLMGTIDTAEKYEARRFEMAQREWRRLEANDSLECRNCHTFDAMDAERQARFAARQHATARREGATCIDCHKGVAHTLPAGTAAVEPQ